MPEVNPSDSGFDLAIRETNRPLLFARCSAEVNRFSPGVLVCVYLSHCQIGICCLIPEVSPMNELKCGFHWKYSQSNTRHMLQILLLSQGLCLALGAAFGIAK